MDIIELAELSLNDLASGNRISWSVFFNHFGNLSNNLKTTAIDQDALLRLLLSISERTVLIHQEKYKRIQRKLQKKGNCTENSETFFSDEYVYNKTDYDETCLELSISENVLKSLATIINDRETLNGAINYGCLCAIFMFIGQMQGAISASKNFNAMIHPEISKRIVDSKRWGPTNKRIKALKALAKERWANGCLHFHDEMADELLEKHTELTQDIKKPALLRALKSVAEEYRKVRGQEDSYKKTPPK